RPWKALGAGADWQRHLGLPCRRGRGVERRRPVATPVHRQSCTAAGRRGSVQSGKSLLVRPPRRMVSTRRKALRKGTRTSYAQVAENPGPRCVYSLGGAGRTVLLRFGAGNVGRVVAAARCPFACAY